MEARGQTFTYDFFARGRMQVSAVESKPATFLTNRGIGMTWQVTFCGIVIYILICVSEGRAILIKMQITVAGALREAFSEGSDVYL